MSKHTPTPWEAIDADERFPLDWPCGELAIDDGNCGYIAKVICHTDEATTRANARLIASSPELLEAAQMIVRGFAMMEAVDPRGWQRWKERCGDVGIEFKQGLCDASAAIARAEGK